MKTNNNSCKQQKHAYKLNCMMIRQQKYTSAAAAKRAAAAIRAQLHQELESKKLCTYQPHECSQLTLDGHNYCLRHIMEDKSAPYRQCSYVFNSNGKRCHLPAPRGERKEYAYCTEHSFKSHLTRIRATSRHQPINSIDTLLDSLTHYVNAGDDLKTQLKLTEHPTETEESTSEAIKTLDPYVDINVSAVNASCSKILDYGSDSESDVEAACYTSVWHDAQADSSDDESIDSEQEDTLKHAGIYTAEEVTRVTRDKLIRLQSLYIEQFKYLQHGLKERRREYLNGLRREKEAYGSIHDQIKDSLKEKRLYNKLKALNHYHKKHGIDAVMNKKFTELRAKLTDGANVKPITFTKCSFVEGGVKCGERALVMTKHCRRHILHDRQQVLFKRCSRIEADTECNEPVLGIFKDATCKFHTEFPVVRNYRETRVLDDSDMENSSDIHDNQPALDTMASSSCDSKTAATSSSTQAINFSNQFPSSSTKMDLFDLESSREHYLDVSNEVDVTSVDDIGQYSGQEESNSSVQMSTTNQYDVIETSEVSVIDPDDDMAGIMLELQKDKIQMAQEV